MLTPPPNTRGCWSASSSVRNPRTTLGPPPRRQRRRNQRRTSVQIRATPGRNLTGIIKKVTGSRLGVINIGQRFRVRIRGHLQHWSKVQDQVLFIMKGHRFYFYLLSDRYFILELSQIAEFLFGFLFVDFRR